MILRHAAKIGGVTKKLIRDEGGIPSPARTRKIEALLKDLVGLLLSLAVSEKTDLETVLQKNIDKLQSRQIRDKLKGDGDYR